MVLAEAAAALEGYLLPFAFASLALLGLGYLLQGPRSHYLRMAGWVGFAAYWPFQAPGFFAEGDPVNGWFALLGAAALVFVAYHERRSLQWDEDPDALRWFAGATFVAATSYFVLFEIQPIRELLIYSTGIQSAWTLDLLFGTESVAVQAGTYDGVRATHLCLSEGYGDPVGALDRAYCADTAGFPHYAVTIIFACTALQSIMIFVGAVQSTRASPRRKRLAYAAVVPTIYALNLLRNAVIVWGYKVKKWSMFGIPPFDWMHSYVMKAGSLVALVVIALAVFHLLPELHKNVLDLLDLPQRNEPGFYEDPPEPPASEAPPAPGLEAEADA